MREANAKILLASVFMARGTSFFFSRNLLQVMQPLGILAVRFSLASLLLMILFHRRLTNITLRDLLSGALLGVLYTLCMICEMYGLRVIETGVSSLIENMAIVLVPIIVAIAGRAWPARKTMFCAVIAVVGVGFLSQTQFGHGGNAFGLFLVILASFFYALSIIATEYVCSFADPTIAGIMQILTMAVLSFIPACLTQSFAWPQSAPQWIMMMMLVLVCTCFGFTFQPLGQKYVPAETAAVLSVVNPLTASVMGITIAGESISFAKVIGYALVLTALFLYNARPLKRE